MIDIQFLGTSAGMPTKKRNVSAIAVKAHAHKYWTLIDCGEATQHQLLYTNLSVNLIETICITHIHGDHCYGLAGLLASMAMNQRSDVLHIIAPDGIAQLIQAHIDYTELRLNFDIIYYATETLEINYQNTSFYIESCALSHRVPSYAYKLTHHFVKNKLNIDKLNAQGIEKGPIWGQLETQATVNLDNGTILNSKDFLITEKKTRNIIIGGDNDTPQCLDPVIANCDTLVHEATYTQEIADKIGNFPQHCSAKSIAKYAQKNAIPTLILTHFSARYQSETEKQPNISEIADEAAAHYDGKLILAEDFSVFTQN